MKAIRILSLALLIVAYGTPLPVVAQATSDTFNLPDGITGQLYRANIESVLREKYQLKVETDTSSSLFRWTLASGEMPQGLILRANGTILGTPRVSRDTPYQFKVKVTNREGVGMAPLQISFSIAVSTPQIRMVQVKTPRLVPVGESTSAPNENRDAVKAQSSVFKLDASLPALDAVAFNNAAAHHGVGGRSDDLRTLEARFLRPPSAPAAAANKPEPIVQYGDVPVPTTACDLAGIPTGEQVYTLDARNGNLSNNSGDTVSPRQRFKKKELVTIVVDNKNPYLYTYKYSSNLTPVVDAALNAFVPLITGTLSDLGEIPEQDDAPTAPKAAAPVAPAPQGVAPPVPKCQRAITLTNQLIIDVQTQIIEATNLKTAVNHEKDKSRQLTNNYLAERLPIFSLNQPRSALCSASTNLANVVNGGVDAGSGIDPANHRSPAAGVDPLALDEIVGRADALTQEAEVFNRRVSVIREAFPDCLNVETDEDKLLREHLREVAENADKLAKLAEGYRAVVRQIREDLTAAIQGRNSVIAVLNNQFSFYELHSEGGYEETNAGPIQLEVTPRSGVVEAVAVAQSPFKLDFTFGQAPFFSISGGLLFSPLRKREFVRVQGFERDDQGNLVLTDGKPNLTTVVGLKEDSPTRIVPAIFLNGRLTSPSRSKIIDGVYMSLGLTAKNDNQGTDVEFLLGPSVSMFDRSMFFTVGGYAGKQQKLTGGLFEGFAVPTGVDELPIQKNYRWHLGFAVSYRVPVNK